MSLYVLIATLGLGFVLGLKHALDADHIVAVSTIVSEHKSIFKSSLVGTFWGLGHTVSLFLIGLLVILLRLAIPPRVALWMEFGVAIMLVLLGVNIVWKFFRGKRIHIHTHEHDGLSKLIAIWNRRGAEVTRAPGKNHRVGFWRPPRFGGGRCCQCRVRFVPGNNWSSNSGP